MDNTSLLNQHIKELKNEIPGFNLSGTTVIISDIQHLCVSIDSNSKVPDFYYQFLQAIVIYCQHIYKHADCILK